VTCSRRVALELLALSLAGCPTPEPLPPPAPSAPDLVVARLADLVTVVGLDWAVLSTPASLWATPWLEPHLRRILRDDRLDLLARATGIDLRRARDLALASHDGVVTYLVRHPLEAIEVERRFRERLTGNERRAVHADQLVTVWGKVGTATRGFASIGRDVAVFQYGGDERRGPLAIGVLRARGALRDIPMALDDPTLAAIHEGLGGAPIEMLWPGPFDDPIARGARGLLGGSTGFGVGLMPSEVDTLTLTVIVAGDFVDDPQALRFLELAWDDLGGADLGHLLGLDRPRAAPATVATPLGLVLTVDLDAALLVDGLAAATLENVREMMNES
jgi:hypothetical protein